MTAAHKVEIEVVLALAEHQVLRSIAVPAGVTVAEAVDLSGIAEEFPMLPVKTLALGIWGKVVDRSRQVQSGYRIEIYRHLPVDPRLARRKIAVQGGFLGRRGPESD